MRRRNRYGAPCAGRPRHITRLPVHTAINLWVARGTPRAAFVAGTLPMKDLYDPGLAEHHLATQRERGGHYLAHLPAPLGDEPPPQALPGARPTQAPAFGERRAGDRAQPVAATAGAAATQLQLEDL